jgi:hypothetical protein
VITYVLTHPQLSEPLEIDSAVYRRPEAVAAHASMYVLWNFDEMLPLDEWTVTLKEAP